MSTGQGHPPTFHALVLLTLVAPLPFGAYADWAWATVAAVFGVLLGCWGLSVLRGRFQAVAPPRYLRWAAAVLALSMLWAMLQSVGFTPEAWHHPVWRDAAAALRTPYRGAVSLDPVASRESVLRIVTYGAVFWLAFQYGCNSAQARFALRAVAVGAACYALYGLVVAFSGAEFTLIGFEKTAYRDAVTATFVNPNSFGTYCGIGLLCATAALRHRFVRRPTASGLRIRLGFVITEFVPRNTVLVAAWLVLAAALLLSLSRGAVVATCLALLVFECALVSRRRVWVRALALRSIAFAFVGGVLLLLAGEGVERQLWELGPDWAKRSQIYAQTAKAIAEHPVSGTGLGTFESVYRSYRGEDIRPGVRMAHNDYLELALELGVPAAALFVLGLAALAIGCARGVGVRKRDFAIPATGLAAGVLVGVHALVDFSLQIPSVAATFSLVLGIAVAQGSTTAQRAVRLE